MVIRKCSNTPTSAITSPPCMIASLPNRAAAAPFHGLKTEVPALMDLMRLKARSIAPATPPAIASVETSEAVRRRLSTEPIYGYCLDHSMLHTAHRRRKDDHAQIG